MINYIFFIFFIIFSYNIHADQNDQRLDFLEHKMYYEVPLTKKGYIQKYKMYEYK